MQPNTKIPICVQSWKDTVALGRCCGKSLWNWEDSGRSHSWDFRIACLDQRSHWEVQIPQERGFTAPLIKSHIQDVASRKTHNSLGPNTPRTCVSMAFSTIILALKTAPISWLWIQLRPQHSPGDLAERFVSFGWGTGITWKIRFGKFLMENLTTLCYKAALPMCCLHTPKK